MTELNTVKPDGILTTKSNVVAHAYKNNIKNSEMQLAVAIFEGENFKKFDWFEITD